MLVTILIAIGLALAVLIFFGGRWLRQARAAAIAVGTKAVEGREVVVEDRAANCFGLESAGAGQIRGNGYLAATADEIVFVMWVPRRVVHIRRPLLVEADTTRSHLGKSASRDLLRLRWINDEGDEETAAFAVRNLPAWLAELV